MSIPFKKISLLFLVCLVTLITRSQQAADTVIKGKIHADIQWGYSCQIPSWFRQLDTPDDIFGGLLPAIDTIENSILFKGFPKTQFKTMDAFENWVVKDYTVGQESRWDPDQIILLKNLITDFTGPGIAYRVQILNQGVIYNCCYVLFETPKAFVWVDYTATNTTYKQQYPQFMEMVQTIKAL